MPDCEDQSPACQKDRKEYDDAAADRGAAEAAIIRWSRELAQAQRGTIASGGVVVAGVAVAWATGWTGLGFIVGVGIAGMGAAGLGVSLAKERDRKQKLAASRADCEAARQKMQDAYDKAVVDCKNPDCVPPPVPACP